MIYGYKYWRSLVSATERIVESGIAGTVYAGKRRSTTFISIFLYFPVRPSAARNFSHRDSYQVNENIEGSKKII